MKPGYITMTRRQSNNQWSGSIGSPCPPPKNSECKNPLEKFSTWFFGIKTSSLLIIFRRAKLSTRSITHLCWCNWRTFWRKNASCRKVTKGVLFLHDKAPAHWALATQNRLTYLGFQCHPALFSGSDLIGLPPVPQTRKTIDRSPFFIWHGGHCCCRDLVGWTTFWIFFEWLAKVRAMG